MEIIKVILFDNKSGGNLQLGYLSKKLSNFSNKNNSLILIKDKQIKIKNVLLLFKKLYELYFSNEDIKIIYSDPFLSFLEILPYSKNIIRFVQSIDEELYNNHPKLLNIFQFALNKLIKIFNSYGNNSIYVCSLLCSDYMKAYKRKVSFIKPTLSIKEYSKPNKNHGELNQIISIMSNPEAKGISILNKISLDFPELKFIVITNKANLKMEYPNITFKKNCSRNEIFKILNNALCHISCSSKESIGLPMYEAMACNIPSIFKLNQSNLFLLKNKLLYFQEYDREILNKFLKICRDPYSRLELICHQQEIISKNFYIDFKNKY